MQNDMRWREVIKPHNSGMFVGVHLSPNTVRNLREYIQENNIPNSINDEDLHITLIFDKEREFPYTTESLDIVADPSTFEMLHLGMDSRSLVVKFECQELTDIHTSLKEEFGIPWDWPDYKAHISLSYDSPIELHPDPPKFPLELTETYIRPWEE